MECDDTPGKLACFAAGGAGNMTLIAQAIADRLILKPTIHPLPAPGKQLLRVPFRKGHLDVWTQRVGTNLPDEVELFALKFSGTGGRAERSTYHPMDYWSDLRAEIWSVNPPGYGGSSGHASVRWLAEASQRVFEDLQQQAAGRPIVILGNSLGTVMALHLAARYPVAGLILRNPPPLRQLLVGRHGWWNLWLGAWLIARRVPSALCSIQNAERTSCPAVFISSSRDRIVPPMFQEKVFQAFGGPSRVLRLAEADHVDPLNLHEQREYELHLQWLREQFLPASKEICSSSSTTVID